MEIGDQVMLPQRKTTIKPPWDADPWTVTEVKGSQLRVQRREKRRLRAKNLVKVIKQRVKDKLGIDNRTRKEMEEPEIDVTIEDIREQIAKEKERQREPANPGEEEDGEHQEQEGVPQQDLGDQDPDPPAAAKGQNTDSEDEGVCATCGLREPDTGGAEVIDWVQCDTCQKWFHDACVGWEKEATGDFLCRDCEQAGDAGAVKLVFRKQDRAWGIEKKTSPSKRERKKRKGLAAKRDKRK